MADIQMTSHDGTAADSPEDVEMVNGEHGGMANGEHGGMVNGEHGGMVNGNHGGMVNGNHGGMVNGNHGGMVNGNHGGMVNGNHGGMVSGNGVEVQQQQEQEEEAPTPEELQQFDIDRRDYILISFNLPTQLSDAKIEELIRRFQREGESSYQFGGENAQWRMDVRLIQEGELPEESINEAGEVVNHLVDIYHFTTSDLLMLDTQLGEEGILHVAEDASWIMDRLRWELRERQVRVPSLFDELQRPEEERIPDTGSALLDKIHGEDYYWDSRKLYVCAISFHGMFERFAYSWQRVLQSVRWMGTPDVPPAQLLDLVPPNLLAHARWFKRRFGERVVNFWQLWDRLRDVEHPDEIYTDPDP